jgi:glycosyltransferase involved in cell wall biosynthesis
VTEPSPRLRSRTIVVLSYHFPPDGAIGGLRWAGLTKHLVPLGWRSIVVTAAEQLRAPGANGVRVLRAAKRLTANDVYRRLRSRTGGSEAAGSAPVPTSSAPRPEDEGLARGIRRQLAALLVLPDEGRGWIARATLALRSQIRAERPDVVISSGPPHSAHVAAWIATRSGSARWYVDLRDPWAGPISDVWAASRRYGSSIAPWLDRVLERRVIDAADGVIVNSRWLAAGLADRYPESSIAWLPNGFDPDSLPAERPPAYPGLGIAHLGTLYGQRNLAPAIEALAAYVRERPEARRDGTKLRVAGEVDSPQLSTLRRNARDSGVEDLVEFYGVVPRQQALEILLRSRLCLVLAQGQMIEIPGKLHESIGAGTPAVVIGPSGSACAAEAERLGAAFVESGSTGALLEVFRQAGRSTLAVAPEQRDRVSYARIAEDLVGIVGDGARAR